MGGGFHGAAVITLDAKGRVAIPTRHRDALLDGGKSLVVTAHPDCCVLIYPASEWEPVRLRVEAFPSFHPQASWWKRLLLGFEEHLTPDGSGRILLSPALRVHAKLEREAMRSEGTRLNSSHSQISYGVFCLKKKKYDQHDLHPPRTHFP